MIDIWMVFYAVLAAIISTVLYILINRPFFQKIQTILLPLCAIVIAIYVIIINPQYETGFFFIANQFLSFVLVPSFILMPLPFLENRTGTIFNKISVISGSFVAAFFSYIIFPIIIHLPTRQWQIQSLGELACLSVLSFLIFIVIQRIQQSRSRITEEKRTTPVSESAPPASDKRTIIILVVCLLLLCSPLFFLDTYMRSSSTCGAFPVYRIDQSNTTPGSITELTDAKLKAYPKLKSLITKSHNVQPQNSPIIIYQIETNVTDLGTVRFSCNEESYRSMSNLYFRYEGNLYYTGIAWIS
jgi:hypothetical protein